MICFILICPAGILSNPSLASQYPSAFLQMAAAVGGTSMTSPALTAQATSQAYPVALNSTGNTTISRIPPMYTIKSLLASPSQVDIERAKLMIKKEGEWVFVILYQ